MKKNILTVVIMAATVINLVLTCVLVFSVVPAMNKTTNLIDKVASVIDLEIDDKQEDDDWTMADLDTYTITYEKKETLNLQPNEGDDTPHYYQLGGISISFNQKAEDYQTVSEQIKAQDVHAQSIIKETISSHRASDFDQAKVQSECVKRLQETYNTKCIVEVIFVNPLLN
ncbi:MAG: hypothetical protein J5819_06015 [Eubacterium sp.]|nr:hypothetical protein [Eubacterium sp.]